MSQTRPSLDQISAEAQDAPRWAMAYQHLPRCQCGRFLKPQNPVCRNDKCELKGQAQGTPLPWPPTGIRFTTDRAKVGQPVADPQPQPQPETLPTAPAPDQPDWTRLEALSGKIDAAATHWAYRTGEDAEELAQEMTLAIVERATADPGFLGQKDSYIVTHGVWRALDKVRAQWQDSTGYELDEELTGDWAVEAAPPRDDILQVLGGEGRALVNAIVEAGDAALKGNGTLNVSALARRLGTPQRTMYRRAEALRGELKAVGYGV